ncbi:MAG: hypothetical protein OXU62_02645 [Gammaproteobacteria bacterium]|nr:hypothetical protein [Gammaproteobacteria bacterium]
MTDRDKELLRHTPLDDAQFELMSEVERVRGAGNNESARSGRLLGAAHQPDSARTACSVKGSGPYLAGCRPTSQRR